MYWRKVVLFRLKKRLLAKRKQEEIEESLAPLTAQELEERRKYQAKIYRRACIVALRKTTSTC